MESSRPRVLRLITRLNIGGPARQALLLSKELPQFETRLLVGRVDPTEGELLDPEVHIERLGSLVRPIAPMNDVQALRAIRRTIAHWRPHLVHTHMAKAGTLARSTRWSLRHRPALVHTFHGHVLEGYFSPPVQKAFIATERALARGTDVLVAVSEEVKLSLLELGIGSEDQYRVIPLGFDLSSFLGVDSASGELRGGIGLGETTPLIGVVGRLVPIKDHATLLHAMRRLPDEVHLAVIGDGELRAPLEALTESLGLGRRVHFVGWWRDMWKVYADLDAVVLSSRNEGSPVALIEGQASGCPAVATDVGGVRSVVKDGVSGLLVPPRDPEALAGAVESVLADAEGARRMGTKGRSFVRERFSSERLVSDIRSVYDDVLSR